MTNFAEIELDIRWECMNCYASGEEWGQSSGWDVASIDHECEEEEEDES